ncbi:MAG TPA: tyrosine-type recombinase/integrase [Clostridia bacterium]|nr:tyrosine-type recombinase/integrase [Clostridia bacterium]
MMNASIIEQKIDEVKHGLKYRHFTFEELTRIYENDSRLEKRLKSVSLFQSKYSDLSVLEKQLSLSGIKSFKKDELPHWYILKLVQYGRIKLGISALMELRPYREDIFICDSFLVNTGLLNKFEGFAINNLGYSKLRVEKAITIQLFRLILYFQKPVEQLVAEIDNSLRIIENAISQLKYRQILCAVNILSNMGYKTDYDNGKRRIPLNRKEPLRNENIGILKAIDEYSKYKYEKTIVSHIRAFFNYLWDYFPDIDMIQKLNNRHIEAFIENQKTTINIRGKTNSSATINHRLEALDKMLEYYRTEYKLNIPVVITKYDKLKEPMKYTKYESREDIFNLIQAIANSDYGSEYIQHKMVLLILVDTGRRIHEVLCLKYDCYKDGQVYFHKTKNGFSGWQIVGETTINAIRVLKEAYANDIQTRIYSRIDKHKVRRLLPSKYYKGKSVLSYEAVSDFFNRIQIDNDIIDENGKPRYSLHDTKRNFVTCMLGAGVKPKEIADYLHQKANSLIPYEVNNEFAVKTLKSVETKGLLLGNSIYGNSQIEKNSAILELLKDVDIVTRHRVNLMTQINRPKSVMPLSLGSCTDYYSFSECGDLICIACDEFKADSLDDFIAYSKKMFRYVLSYKRDLKVNEIENKLLISLKKAYERMELNDKEAFESLIKKIKKSTKREMEADEQGIENDTA